MSAQPQLPGVDRPRTINDIARARERERGSDREPDTLPTAQTLSRLADTLSLILAMLGCPPEHRGFIDAVLGLADGRAHWYDGADILIGIRARGDGADGCKRESLARWTRRARAAFFAWQTGAGLALIECIPGGRETATGELHRTRYRAPLLSIAARVYDLARLDPAWATHPARAIRRAARPLLPQLSASGPALRERAGIGRARHDRPESEFRRAYTALAKGFERAELRGADWHELCAPILALLRERGALPEGEGGGHVCPVPPAPAEGWGTRLSGTPEPEPEGVGDMFVRYPEPELEGVGDMFVRYLPKTCTGQAPDLAELPELPELPDDGRTQLGGGDGPDLAELPELPELPTPERPRPVVALVTSGIPGELRELGQWVGWRYVPDPSRAKPAKCPIDPSTGHRARVNDRSSWGTFERAMRAVELYDLDGVGFVLVEGGGVAVVDLDGCADPDTGELTPDAWAIVDQLDSYTEISPSGAGVHVWCMGELPAGGRRKGGVEMYDRGRFICTTGARVTDTPSGVELRGPELAELHRATFGALDPGPDRGTLDPDHTHTVYALSDDAGVVEAILRSRHAGLYLDTPARGASANEGDLSLAGRLVFFTGGDAARVDALFRASGRMRPKWDEVHFASGETYGQRTVAVAIDGHEGDYYTGRRP